MNVSSTGQPYAGAALSLFLQPRPHSWDMMGGNAHRPSSGDTASVLMQAQNLPLHPGSSSLLHNDSPLSPLDGHLPGCCH